LRIVAIGSSSTEGSDLADRSRAYPAQLDMKLARRFGPGRFTVINRGRGGEGIPETVARFTRDVVSERPDIVIWQLGANDIVRHADVDTMAQHVRVGLDMLARTGSLVILMDSQVAPRISQSPTLEPMQAMLKREAMAHQVVYWSRYGLMEAILADGRTTLSDLVRDDGLHMSVPMHACTAAALVDVLEQPLASRQIVAERR
jgi:lysophospholipase L1-like esterase